LPLTLTLSHHAYGRSPGRRRGEGKKRNPLTLTLSRHAYGRSCGDRGEREK